MVILAGNRKLTAAFLGKKPTWLTTSKPNSGPKPVVMSQDKRSDQTQGAASERPQFYGRRTGKKLRPGRQGLVETLLPKLQIALPDQGFIDPGALFDRPPQALWMEIGFGAGEHLAGLAERHPERGYIGSEPFINGVGAYLSKHEALGLDNVRLFADDVRLLLPKLPADCLDGLYILFADPWPKTRHHRRRMIHPDNLQQFARVMKPGADLWFATDHMDYGRWALWHILRDPNFTWEANGPEDWSRPMDWIPTRYEQKALTQGGACVYYRFRKI